MLEVAEQEFGISDTNFAAALSNHALAFDALGRYEDAEPLLKQAIKIGTNTISENHPDYAKHLCNLASHFYSMSRYDEAEPLYKQAIEIAKTTLGPDHPDTELYKANLAKLQSSC